jgi:hypothetical protein
MSNATFTKLKSGDWGLRIQGDAASGQSVQVKRKDGTSESKTVGKVLWSGNGITLATIAGNESSSSGGSRSSGRNCCSACGKPGKLVCDVEDGLMKHYNCCDMPPDGY